MFVGAENEQHQKYKRVNQRMSQTIEAGAAYKKAYDARDGGVGVIDLSKSQPAEYFHTLNTSREINKSKRSNEQSTSPHRGALPNLNSSKQQFIRKKIAYL